MKSAFDWTLAGIAIVISLPIMAVIAALVWATMGRPIFFSQERSGLHGKAFRLLKFRTMQLSTPLLHTDEQRLTKVGSFLRKTSLDELPSLWNVLKGDMSLVGPRPLLAVYWQRYSEIERRRHNVKPGLTGWAQINGRNALTWKEKFALDLWYLEHRSFRLDIFILAKTVGKVIHREGVAADNHATMPEFQGSGSENSQEIRSSV